MFTFWENYNYLQVLKFPFLHFLQLGAAAVNFVAGKVPTEIASKLGLGLQFVPVISVCIVGFLGIRVFFSFNILILFLMKRLSITND